MADIVLAAFNARYAHCAFGARCLLANLGDLRERAALLEFDLSVLPRTAAETILGQDPRIVGIGCHVWNIELATKVAALLKTIRPGVALVLGGPEIGHETDQQEIARYADHVVCGEGEAEFPKCCRHLLRAADFLSAAPESRQDAGDAAVPPASSVPGAYPPRIIRARPVDMARTNPPYDLYSDEDIAHRTIYVEASRGCPFHCDYCMSSLDSRVRPVPLEPFLAAMQRLLDRGARSFKFIDRVFNLDLPRALRILAFFRDRHVPGMRLHFEIVPGLLPDELLEALTLCPAGMIQFEAGIQTFNPEVARRIRRPLDTGRIEANLRRLRTETGVHLHADLIAGLPGEDLASLAAGFDRLLALGPHEIQLGILKRLRGTAIDRHAQEWALAFSPHPPYEVLQTRRIPFGEMQRIQRFARYWDLVANRGRFPLAAPLVWRDAPSPFAAFMAFSDWLYARTGTTGNLHLVRLAGLLLEFLVRERGMDERAAADALRDDYRRGNRPDTPGFLGKHGPGNPA